MKPSAKLKHGVPLISRRRFHWLRAFILLCSGIVPASHALAVDVADPLVAHRLKAFYEVFTGRKLTDIEIRDVTREFVEDRASRDRAAIREAARRHGFDMILMREEPDHPAALTIRHQYIEHNYFRARMRGSVELRLMMEADPVRVIDPKAKRLMTERDVIALANLRRFSRSDGEPRHREPPRERVEALVLALNGSIARGATLPQLYGEAAAYWAGVRQQWPWFNAQQRRMSRAYAANTWRTMMPVEMYVGLWGLDRPAASRRWSNDVSARIRGRSDALEGDARLQAALATALEP